MKPITIIIVFLLVAVVAVAVVARTMGIGGGDGDSSNRENTPNERARTSRQGTPTATFIPPTRSPTPPRATPLPSERPIIRLSDEGYESQTLNNAIAQFIIEHGFGYPTEAVVTTHEGMQDLIETGGIDLEMEGWQHNAPEWYRNAIRNQTVENLGQTYEDGPQFFVIPLWMADEFEIRSIDDMKAHWELVQDPNDTTRGLFITCPKEAGCAKVNSVKLEAYGLNKTYNLISPKSFPELEDLLEKAQATRQPVFGYYWEPAVLNTTYEWQVLEEPPYTEECWDRVRDASDDKIPRPIEQACEYPRLPIDKIANVELEKKAPDVVKMLELMDIGLAPLNEIIAWAKENDIEDSEQMAIRYLETYSERYRDWMPDENYINVQKKVRERRGY